MSDESILVFQSHPISIMKPEGTPRSFRYKGFSVSEKLLPQKPQKNPKKDRDYPYVIFFVSRVETEAEVNQKYSEFQIIKNAIDAIWHFVFGIPYGADIRSGTTSQNVLGWKTNRNAILAKLPKRQIDIYIEFETTSIFQVREWPLPQLLHAIDSYLKSNPTLKFLMELHATTLSTENENIRFTLLGKLADLCEVLLPGETREVKISNLDPYFKNRLVFDADIFRLANTRFQTRHAAGKTKKELHPGMSGGEKEDFQSDVDTLVRAIVFQNFGIRPTFHEGWRFPANCAVNWSGKIGKERSQQRDKRNA